MEEAVIDTDRTQRPRFGEERFPGGQGDSLSTFREQLKGRFAALGHRHRRRVGTAPGTAVEHAGAQRRRVRRDGRGQQGSRDIPRGATGRILDRDGNPLVSNRATLAVCVAPSAKDDEELLYALSTLVDVPVEEIRERLESTQEEALTPRVITLDASPETVAYLSEHESEFPGVEIQARAVREYPLGQQAAHVLGYTGEVSEDQLEEEEFEGYVLGDIVGKTGAERRVRVRASGDQGLPAFRGGRQRAAHGGSSRRAIRSPAATSCLDDRLGRSGRGRAGAAQRDGGRAQGRLRRTRARVRPSRSM